jgi:hypothetical protein
MPGKQFPQSFSKRKRGYEITGWLPEFHFETETVRLFGFKKFGQPFGVFQVWRALILFAFYVKKILQRLCILKKRLCFRKEKWGTDWAKHSLSPEKRTLRTGI